MNYCSEHPDLVRLCTSCAHEHCPDGKCKQYRQMRTRLGLDGNGARTVGDAESAGTPEVLIKLSAAIKCLDDLAKTPDCDDVFSTFRLKKIRNELDSARSKAYGHLIDWRYIAKKME